MTQTSILVVDKLYLSACIIWMLIILDVGCLDVGSTNRCVQMSSSFALRELYAACSDAEGEGSI